MKFRDKEKNLLVDTFMKTAEYVIAILVLGTLISDKFNFWIFFIGLIVFISLIIAALIISLKTREENQA